MLSPLPRRSVWAYCFAHFTQPYQPSPKWQSGRPAHCPFRGLLGVHSRYGLHTRAVTVYRDTLTRGFSHFVTSMSAPVASGWSGCRVGLTPTGKRRLVTAHTQCRHDCFSFVPHAAAFEFSPASCASWLGRGRRRREFIGDPRSGRNVEAVEFHWHGFSAHHDLADGGEFIGPVQ